MTDTNKQKPSEKQPPPAPKPLPEITTPKLPTRDVRESYPTPAKRPIQGPNIRKK